jgi:hypothetical protein
MFLWSSGYDFEAYRSTQVSRPLSDGLPGCLAGPLSGFCGGSICRRPGLQAWIILLRVGDRRKESHFSDGEPTWVLSRSSQDLQRRESLPDLHGASSGVLPSLPNRWGFRFQRTSGIILPLGPKGGLTSYNLFGRKIIPPGGATARAVVSTVTARLPRWISPKAAWRPE